MFGVEKVLGRVWAIDLNECKIGIKEAVVRPQQKHELVPEVNMTYQILRKSQKYAAYGVCFPQTDAWIGLRIEREHLTCRKDNLEKIKENVSSRFESVSSHREFDLWS